MNMSPAIAVVAIMMVSVCWVIIMVAMVLVGRIWVRAMLNGTPVPFFRIVAMRIRGCPPRLLVDAYCTLRREGSTATLDDVETAFLESGFGMLSSGDLVDAVKRHYAKR